MITFSKLQLAVLTLQTLARGAFWELELDDKAAEGLHIRSQRNLIYESDNTDKGARSGTFTGYFFYDMHFNARLVPESRPSLEISLEDKRIISIDGKTVDEQLNVELKDKTPDSVDFKVYEITFTTVVARKLFGSTKPLTRTVKVTNNEKVLKLIHGLKAHGKKKGLMPTIYLFPTKANFWIKIEDTKQEDKHVALRGTKFEDRHAAIRKGLNEIKESKKSEEEKSEDRHKLYESFFTHASHNSTHALVEYKVGGKTDNWKLPAPRLLDLGKPAVIEKAYDKHTGQQLFTSSSHLH